MRVSSLCATLLVCAQALVGCGIKGSLYLPDIPEAPATAAQPDNNKPATNR